MYFSGKTLLAKAIANESGINFISVKGPELLNMVFYKLFFKLNLICDTFFFKIKNSMLVKVNEQFDKSFSEHVIQIHVLYFLMKLMHYVHVVQLMIPVQRLELLINY